MIDVVVVLGDDGAGGVGELDVGAAAEGDALGAAAEAAGQRLVDDASLVDGVHDEGEHGHDEHHDDRQHDGRDIYNGRKRQGRTEGRGGAKEREKVEGGINSLVSRCDIFLFSL